MGLYVIILLHIFQDKCINWDLNHEFCKNIRNHSRQMCIHGLIIFYTDIMLLKRYIKKNRKYDRKSTSFVYSYNLVILKTLNTVKIPLLTISYHSLDCQKLTDVVNPVPSCMKDK